MEILIFSVLNTTKIRFFYLFKRGNKVFSPLSLRKRFIINTMEDLLQKIFSTDFLFRWQNLVGSALGPFLAIILSVLGFYFKGKIQKYYNRKEAVRRAEISFSITLNQIHTIVVQLNDFVLRIKKLITEIEKIDNPNHFSLHETNFPPIINIYFDEELLKMKFKSYYIHNKILIIDTGIRWNNSTIQKIKCIFEKLLKRNEMMAEKVNPTAQRKDYLENLKGYIEMVDQFLRTLKTQNIKSLVQAKVYNLMLMKKYYFTIWKYEGASLKYFKNNKKKEKYNGDIAAVDRVDSLLEGTSVALKIQ